MLALERKERERVLIGGNIVVTVVRIGNGKVKLGFEAPPDVKILRDDAHDKTGEGKGEHE